MLSTLERGVFDCFLNQFVAMNYLLFHLKHLTWAPFAAVVGLADWLRDWLGVTIGDRTFLMGMPSFLFALFGLSALLWARIGVEGALEERYLGELKRRTDRKSVLVDELRREIQVLQASQQKGSKNVATASLLASDDPRSLELESLRSGQGIVLQKLIDLNPDEPDYLFQFGLLSFEQVNNKGGRPGLGQCLALLNLASPLDKPGYVKGHLWLANYYMAAKVNTRVDAMKNLQLAAAHANQCLKVELDNLRAKQIKATLLLAQKKNLPTAYELFLELFEADPFNYKALIVVNNLLDRTERNEVVLKKAMNRFNEKLARGSMDTGTEKRCWSELISCYIETKELVVAEQKLLAEIEKRVTAGETDVVWAERMLSSVLVARTFGLSQTESNATTKRLGFLESALKYDPNNTDAKMQLVRVAGNLNAELSKRAIEIYDFANDVDPPAKVLNEIGSQALSCGDYLRAYTYFELANNKAPNNPEILNNLAYIYIVGERSNPQRALVLVDRAIQQLTTNAQKEKYNTYFFDTRAQALIKMKRWTDAAADLETALNSRPENVDILRSLIECYREAGLDASPYEERLRVANEALPKQ
jgi:tetratricopeptide (TPR) repeat protein